MILWPLTASAAVGERTPKEELTTRKEYAPRPQSGTHRAQNRRPDVESLDPSEDPKRNRIQMILCHGKLQKLNGKKLAASSAPASPTQRNLPPSASLLATALTAHRVTAHEPISSSASFDFRTELSASDASISQIAAEGCAVARESVRKT